MEIPLRYDAPDDAVIIPLTQQVADRMKCSILNAPVDNHPILQYTPNFTTNDVDEDTPAHAERMRVLAKYDESIGYDMDSEDPDIVMHNNKSKCRIIGLPLGITKDIANALGVDWEEEEAVDSSAMHVDGGCDATARIISQEDQCAMST